MVKKNENRGNLIYLNPPLNNQENTNESEWKLNGSYLKVIWKFNESMNVHKRSWTFGFNCHECPK
jgi:hypothetical protein